MHRLLRRLVLAVLVASAAAAGCGPAGATGSAGSSSPSTAAVSSPDEAAQRVIEANPEFEGIGPFDPELIGGCCWYEASAVEGGYKVVVRMGWGDCPAGCINEHRWTYGVSDAGEVSLVDESGDPIPPGDFPPAGEG